MAFLPTDVSKEFRRKYDLPTREDPRYKPKPPKKKEGGLIPGLPELPFP